MLKCLSDDKVIILDDFISQMLKEKTNESDNYNEKKQADMFDGHFTITNFDANASFCER